MEELNKQLAGLLETESYLLPALAKTQKEITGVRENISKFIKDNYFGKFYKGVLSNPDENTHMVYTHIYSGLPNGNCNAILIFVTITNIEVQDVKNWSVIEHFLQQEISKKDFTDIVVNFNKSVNNALWLQ